MMSKRRRYKRTVEDFIPQRVLGVEGVDDQPVSGDKISKMIERFQAQMPEAQRILEQKHIHGQVQNLESEGWFVPPSGGSERG